MSVTVRPVSKSDIERISGGYVTNVASQSFEPTMEGTVCSNSLFGESYMHKHDRDYNYDDEYMRTAVITLVEPVLNPFLAGHKYKVWSILLAAILKKHGVSLESIVEAKVAYDVKADRFIPRDILMDSRYEEHIMFGGKLLLYLLDQIDVEGYIKDIAMGAIVLEAMKAAGYKLEGGEAIPGEIVTKDMTKDVDMDGFLFGNYFFVANRGMEWVYDAIDSWLGEGVTELLGQQFSPLAILLAYKNNPEQVRGQVMTDLFVLPYGYRRNIDGRIDPMNRQYNKIVSINNELMESIQYQGIAVKAIMAKYEQLVKYITNLFVGHDNLKKYAGKSYKPLVDMLSGKSGLMRDRMQGSRTDYSGRTVITCDPFMPIDTIGVPKAMLPKLLEANVIVALREKQDENGSFTYEKKNLAPYLRSRKMMYKTAAELSRHLYLPVGRQPTLFYLGIQGFRVRPIDGNSIVLSPLVVMPFNADFDGDQMHIEGVVSEEAKKEVATLMSSTNNLFYPKNGELTVVVRHEIQYGLWIASSITDDPRSKTWSTGELQALQDTLKPGDNSLAAIVYEGVCRQVINIYDKVTINNSYTTDPKSGGKIPAGIAAIKYAIGTDFSKYAIGVLSGGHLVEYGATVTDKNGDTSNAADSPIKDDWVKAVMTKIALTNKGAFVKVTNKVVKLGFCVCKIWPPSISTMVDVDVSEEVEEFNKRISEREHYFNMGIEVESAYNRYFEEEYKKLQKRIEKIVEDSLGPDNGFVRMWKSGAKGSLSNLMQTFGIKGRIMKDDVTPFNTIIGTPLYKQLSGLEHFITAYGSRQGISDKVVATSQPGYLTRKMEHACAQVVIETQDCIADFLGEATQEAINQFIEVNGFPAIKWTFDDVLQFIDESQLADDNVINNDYVREILAPMLVGRNVINERFQSTYVNDIKQANALYNMYVAEVTNNGEFIKKDGIYVRSPVTCLCPCCAKCYGRDLTNNMKYPKVGKPVGFVAAQAVGEPGTQLTMKNFQRGGVASEANLTSSFDKIDAYLSLVDLRDRKESKICLTYDALSPKEGYVRTISTGDGRKKICVTDSKYGKMKNLLGLSEYYVHESTELKEYVEVGDSFQKVQGDLSIKEILRYRGFEDAYKYLVLMLYTIFKAETTVNVKHFEVIVSGMVSYLVLSAIGDLGIEAGEVLSLKEYRNALSNGGAIVAKPTLLGLKTLPKFRKDFFESMIMEDMKTFVPRAVVVNPVDTMTNPKTRISFGLYSGIGSDREGFISSKLRKTS